MRVPGLHCCITETFHLFITVTSLQQQNLQIRCKLFTPSLYYVLLLPKEKSYSHYYICLSGYVTSFRSIKSEDYVPID